MRQDTDLLRGMKVPAGVGHRVAERNSMSASPMLRLDRLSEADGVRALPLRLLRVEVGFAILLVSAFVLPNWIGYRAWILALAIALVLAAAHGLLERRRPVLPAALLVYVGLYAAAALYSDPETFSLIEAGKYFATPALALAFAWAAHSPKTRRRLVLMIIAAVAVQLPFAMGQVGELIAEFGRDPAIVGGVDGITGLLGPDHPGTLAQCGLLAGLLLLGAAYLGVGRSVWLPVGAVSLVLLAVLTSTRAGYVWTPLALAAVAATLWLVARRHVDTRTLVLATAIALISLPVMYVATGALYPGSNVVVRSVSDVGKALVSPEGNVKTKGEVRPEADTNKKLARKARRAGDQADSAGAVNGTGSRYLPGRARQLELAFDISTSGGFDRALLGRGIGTTRFKSEGVLHPTTGEPAATIDRRTQKTNGVWVPRILTETGFLGVTAFAILIAYLVAVTWRNRNLLRSPSWDGAVILALPGVAALTLVSGFFNTVLAVQPYATLFWPLLGIAVAIDRGSGGSPD